MDQIALLEMKKAVSLSKFKELYMAADFNKQDEPPTMFVDMSRIIGDSCVYCVCQEEVIIDQGEFKLGYESENKAIITEIAQRHRINYRDVVVR